MTSKSFKSQSSKLVTGYFAIKKKDEWKPLKKQPGKTNNNGTNEKAVSQNLIVGTILFQ